MTINPESGRWYNAKGEVVELVPSMAAAKAAKGKVVKPSIKHAKHYGLVPSVTSIIRQMDKPGLTAWKLAGLLDASLTLPRIENEPLETFAARVIDDAGEQADKARDQGTEIHAAVEGYFLTGKLPSTEVAYRACTEIDGWLQTHSYKVKEAERGFANAAFAGTPDLLIDGGGLDVLADIKTMEFKDKTYKPYPENGWQLGGYGIGLGHSPLVEQAWNIGIDRRSGACRFYQWPEDAHVENYAAFRALLHLWQIRNHWPRSYELKEIA